MRFRTRKEKAERPGSIDRDMYAMPQVVRPEKESD